MTATCKIDIQALRELEPLAAFSESRLVALANLCVLESASPDTDPFSARLASSGLERGRGLDQGREYVVHSQSERRSSAAAFLLAQRGYKAYLLQGGPRGGEGQA